MKKVSQYCTTSELLFHHLKASNLIEKDYFLKEYYQRLQHFMQLSNDEIARFRSQDEFVIINGCYISPDNLLTARPFIYDGMNKDSIKLANCTFSELVLLTFEASNPQILFHTYLQYPETFELIAENSIGGSANSLYALYYRLESIEFSYNQRLHMVTTELNLIKAIKAIP